MWVDRIILFLIGTAVLFLQGFSYMSVIIMTTAVTGSCIGGYYDRKLPVIIVSACWFVLSIFFHSFIWLWSLFSFEMTKQRLYVLYLLPIASIMTAGFYYSIFNTFTLVIVILLPLVGIILAIKDMKIHSYQKEVISTRDFFIEKELDLSRRNEQLLQDQSSEIEIATLKERGRIAMEIHDNVGHILSRAILQTGAMLATKKDDASKKELDELNGTLNLAMDSIRKSVHGLKDDSFNLQKSVLDCIKDFPNFKCAFHYDMGNDVPKSVQHCFAVIIKEAFSNASKHSNADKIKIDLQEHPAFYKLLFSDNGSKRNRISKRDGLVAIGIDKPVQESEHKGIGIENMKERAAALNGTIKINEANGFSINVVLPKMKGEKIKS